MKFLKIKIIFLIFFIQIAKANDGDVLQLKFHKEIPRRNEKELKIKITGGIGVFYILPGSDDKIVVIDGYSDKAMGKNFVDVNYFVAEDVGYLEFEMAKSSAGRISDNEKWYIKLCRDIPTTLDIVLGASKADIELGGLSLKNLKISTGVSKTNLKFTNPNKITMKRFEIETGAAKFEGEKLGNAKFKTLHFSGGVGSFDIDLSGEILDDAEVNVELGLGEIDIYLPKEVGAIISSSGVFSSGKFDNFFKKWDKYISFNYEKAQKKISIFIESGLGNVRVRWID
ncbi:MAG: cell wall-active antibiotics response protein [Candidatus Kryptonium sp.]|nr:cell wall-active antibiotics response protein [Candidatus Kryptonium sp.]MCX7761572.1 cell wall-active antibiotics response protein [Candidatus Kryptonium sp.]